MMKIALWILLATVMVAGGVAYAAGPVAVGVAEERLADSQPSVKVDRGYMEFRPGDTTPVKFEIFSITGQLIKSVTVKNTPVKVDLPKGFYIVKCDSWTKRVMVK